MKKLIIVSLVVSSIAAAAASVKTSKAVHLSTSQMEAIKGQGTITIFLWIPMGGSSGYYQFQSVQDTGPTGPTGTVYINGPLNGFH